jgi:aspartate-semialdehyde dehydrogenase
MRVAVLGATGSVGRAILQILDQRGFPAGEVVALASQKSAGRQVSMGDTVLTLDDGDTFDFKGVDLVLSATHADVAKRLLPRALEAGARVVDKSSAFRMQKGVPLVVPEVNRHLLAASPPLVASPNCVVIPLAMALAPLHAEAGLKHVVVSTYQSVSGAGQKGMDELYAQVRTVLMAEKPQAGVFAKPIAFNVLPQIGDVDEAGWTDEELKIQKETVKLLGSAAQSGAQSPFAVTVTAVRVPVFVGHSMAVCATFEEPLSAKTARGLMNKTDGVRMFERGKGLLTPLDVAGEDEVFISRVRQDSGVDNTLSFWVSCDNLRKGAALNAVQIAEEMWSL